MTIKNATLSILFCIGAITPHKFLAALGASVIAVSSSSAQSTWSGNINGNWDEAANWNTAPGNGDALTFSGTSNQTNTNDTALTDIGLLTLHGAGWEINDQKAA